MTRGPDFSTRAEGRRAASRAEPWLLAAAALLFAASAASASRSWSEARASEASLGALRAELETDRARLRALEAKRGAGGDLAASRLTLTAEAPPGRVLAQLAELLPPDVRLESVAFTYGARLEIEAQAVARRPAAYDLLLERLTASPLFGEVQPGAETREAEMKGTLRFVYARLP